MTDQNTQGNGTPAASTPPPVTPPAADTGTVQNPEAQAASREAANYRTKLREAEARLTAVQEENERLKESTTATGGTKGELATLKRQVDELKAKTEAAEKTAKEETARRKEKQVDAGLSSIASSVLEASRKYAIRLMKAATVVADDDVLVFNVENEKGEKIQVPATLENAKAYLLPLTFFPSKEAGGAGSGGTQTVEGGEIDWARASSDQKYFEANYDRIMAAKRAGRK